MYFLYTMAFPDLVNLSWYQNTLVDVSLSNHETNQHVSVSVSIIEAEDKN